MNDDHMRELFGEMREDPVPAESLARVRMAVAERVRTRRRVFGMGWKIAVPLAVAGCLTVAMLRVRSAGPEVTPSVKPVAAMPVGAVEQSVPVEIAPPARQIVRKRVRTAAVSAVKPASNDREAPVEGGAREIRIENPFDPDVVIVLIGS